jgi:hypothetical protein
MNDLEKVFNALKKKKGLYDTLAEYHEGKQPTPYLTQRMREIFRGVDAKFTMNFCAVTIAACDERINLTGFESDQKEVEATLNAAWERNEMALEAADIHTDALVLGEAFAIVWPDENNKAQIFYNDARMVHCIYEADNPRKLRMAGKLWEGDDGLAKMTLYYPDHLEYYTTARTKYVDIYAASAKAFVPDSEAAPGGKADNPYGQAPVFQFKINRNCASDLVDVIPLQNGVNKLLADMMVAAEFGAYKQRWVISQSDTSGLKNAPGEVWDLPAGDGIGQGTQAGEFDATDLKNYLDAIDRLGIATAIVTRTPAHYYAAQGGDPSGEALIALEAPLNKKAQDRIDRFRPVWREIGLFICKIEGITALPENITPQFEKPETIQPMTQATIIKTETDAGIPLETALSRTGWSDAEIAAMIKIKDKADAKGKSSLATALLKAQQDMKNQAMTGDTAKAGPGTGTPAGTPAGGRSAGQGTGKAGNNLPG